MNTTATKNIQLRIENLLNEEIVAPLYCRIPGKEEPKKAYVVMDESGTVTAGAFRMLPSAAESLLKLFWAVPPDVCGADLAEKLQSPLVRDLLQRVHDGHSVPPTRVPGAAGLTADAQAARDELKDELEDMEFHTVQVWHPGDWMISQILDRWTGDKKLIDVANELETIARDEGIHVDGNLADALLKIAGRYAKESRHGLSCERITELLESGEIDGERAVNYLNSHLDRRTKRQAAAG